MLAADLQTLSRPICNLLGLAPSQHVECLSKPMSAQLVLDGGSKDSLS